MTLTRNRLNVSRGLSAAVAWGAAGAIAALACVAALKASEEWSELRGGVHPGYWTYVISTATAPMIGVALVFAAAAWSAYAPWAPLGSRRYSLASSLALVALIALPMLIALLVALPARVPKGIEPPRTSLFIVLVRLSPPIFAATILTAIRIRATPEARLDAHLGSREG